jgi:acyl transferase domain-containing protein
LRPAGSAGDPEGRTGRDPRYVPAAGALDDIEVFDAQFFGYSPAEAELLDPQGRIFLECAHEALEEAGHDPDRFRGRIGVYGGASLSGYLWSLLAARPAADNSGAEGPRDPVAARGLPVLLGNDKDYLAARVSYKLGLRGPSITVQTACSTSLVAVQLACAALAAGACDLALAGGVSVAVPHRHGYLFEPDGILSPDGHCRAFDAEAQGTVPGSGAGIVALRRLADALADGDLVHAVIRGVAVNNDGRAKVGFTAPAVEGQIEVITSALAQAEMSPEAIGYV